ncbi:hypothetical protein ACFL9U_04815 [Thermodesulfobacteriota bacterium]
MKSALWGMAPKHSLKDGNMRGKILICVFVIAFLHIASLSKAFSLAEEEQVESLRGLKGVYVTFENLTPDEMMNCSLTTEYLKNLAEKRIGQSGINILTEAEYQASHRKPALKITISLSEIKTPEACHLVNIDVALFQTVSLVDSHKATFQIPTWWDSKTGMSGIIPLNKCVRDAIHEILDAFIVDFVSVNSK